MTNDEISLRVAQCLGIANRSHLEADYEEGNTPDGQDGWNGFYCPRCGCDESSFELNGCYPHYPTDPVSTLSLIHEAEKLDVGFSLYNIKSLETGEITYEAIFYDPWGGPQCHEYKASDSHKLVAIDLAFIAMMDDR